MKVAKKIMGLYQMLSILLRFKRIENIISITGVTDKTIKSNIENGTGKTLELYNITAEEGKLIKKIIVEIIWF